jgi:hypothetical protein
MGPVLYSNDAAAQQGSAPVPSSAPNQSANPVLDSLAEAVKHAQTQVEQAASAYSKTPAYTQGSGQTQPQMPVQKQSPFPNASVTNLNSQVPQTRAGARNKAIGQIAAQGAQLVGNFVKQKQAQKTQALAQDVNRSLELTKGIDEANQVLAQDPNNAQAKAQLQKNNALLGSLLNGKNGKDIAKAYDITFGPGAQDEKNKNAHEKTAMTDAMKQAQQDDKLKQFQVQQPSHMDINPQKEAAAKNLEAVQKQAEALTKTYATMADTVYKEQGSNARTEAEIAGKQGVADTNAASRLNVQQQKDQDEFKLNQQKHTEKMQEIGAQGAQRLAAVKAVKEAGDKSKAQKMAEDLVKATDGNISKEQSEVDKLTQELNKPENKQSENSHARTLIQNQINEHQQTVKALQEQKDQAVLEMHSDPNAAAMYSLIGNDKDQ